MRLFLKKYLLKLSSYFGFLHILRFVNRNQIVIFTLHGIVEKRECSWQPMREQCTKLRFEKVLNKLNEFYDFVTLDEAIAMISGLVPIRPYCAVLTFDDGYKNNYTTALPIFKKLKIPATFFISTGHITSQKPYLFDSLDFVVQFCDETTYEPYGCVEISSLFLSDRKAKVKVFRQFLHEYNLSDFDDAYWQESISKQIERSKQVLGEDFELLLRDDPRTAVMSWNDAADATKAGVIIGSHGADHLKLGTLGVIDLSDQLRRSKLEIETHLDQQCDYLCYPNGSYSAQVIRSAKESGYKAGFTTDAGINRLGDDLFRLHRIGFPLRAEKAHIFYHIYGCNWNGVNNKAKTMVAYACGGFLGREKTGESKDAQKPLMGGSAGQDRIVKNVWIGWLAQSVFLLAGFIMPRMIDSSMGQEALGIWDFSWSIIAYFGLVQGGIISSVNRYVSKYQALDDIENVNISASSVAVILALYALMAVLCTLGVYELLPVVFGDKLGQSLLETQKTVFWLGMSLAVQVSFAVFGGVLAGSFRWDIHFYINGLSRIATFTGMVIVLMYNGRLETLAMIYFFCEAAVLSLRVFFAYRVYPGLRIRLAYVRVKRMKEMFLYGLKTYLPTVSDLVVNQTMSLLIIWFLGPAILAVYTRPRALMRYVQTFMTRYAFVLVPTSSNLHTKGDMEAITKLMISSLRTGAFLLFPVVIFLVIFGENLLQFWMGDGYVVPHLFLMIILAYTPVIFQLPLVNIIAGANMHGRLGLMRLVGSLTGVPIAYIILQNYSLDLKWVVLAFGIPLWFSEGFYVTYFANRYFNMSLSQFFRLSIVEPIILLAPYMISLIVVQMVFDSEPLRQLLFGSIIGGSILALLYWHFVLPCSWKDKAKASCRRVVRL